MSSKEDILRLVAEFIKKHTASQPKDLQRIILGVDQFPPEPEIHLPFTTWDFLAGNPTFASPSNIRQFIDAGWKLTTNISHNFTFLAYMFAIPIFATISIGLITNLLVVPKSFRRSNAWCGLATSPISVLILITTLFGNVPLVTFYPGYARPLLPPRQVPFGQYDGVVAQLLRGAAVYEAFELFVVICYAFFRRRRPDPSPRATLMAWTVRIVGFALRLWFTRVSIDTATSLSPSGAYFWKWGSYTLHTETVPQTAAEFWDDLYIASLDKVAVTDWVPKSLFEVDHAWALAIEETMQKDITELLASKQSLNQQALRVQRNMYEDRARWAESHTRVLEYLHDLEESRDTIEQYERDSEKTYELSEMAQQAVAKLTVKVHEYERRIADLESAYKAEIANCHSMLAEAEQNNRNVLAKVTAVVAAGNLPPSVLKKVSPPPAPIREPRVCDQALVLTTSCDQEPMEMTPTNDFGETYQNTLLNHPVFQPNYALERVKKRLGICVKCDSEHFLPTVEVPAIKEVGAGLWSKVEKFYHRQEYNVVMENRYRNRRHFTINEMNHVREMFETWIKTTESQEQRERAIRVRNAIFEQENELLVPRHTPFLPVLLDMAEASKPEAPFIIFTELSPCALSHACGYTPCEVLTGNSDQPWQYWLLEWYPQKTWHRLKDVARDDQSHRYQICKDYHATLKRYFGDRPELLQRITPKHATSMGLKWDYTLLFRRVMENLGLIPFRHKSTIGTFRPVHVKCEDGTTRLELPPDWELPELCPPLRYGHPDFMVDLAVRVRWRQRQIELGQRPLLIDTLLEPPEPAPSPRLEPAEQASESSSPSSPTPRTPPLDRVEGALPEYPNPSSSSIKPQPAPSEDSPGTHSEEL
ncbi:hypothetical protein PIIN_00116 [Serendipita indica DSM 11827]|uniref:Uncharacterized protein n=1 Tax=Serendipita indica (strain DSM 11827) TaxID=1109443 RepID=G4T4T6_SERID|nr:hypothetical protein PIIN_00116 [Serendipita indica DSM 11827]